MVAILRKQPRSNQIKGQISDSPIAKTIT